MENINVTRAQALAGISALADKFDFGAEIPAEEILRDVFPGLVRLKPPNNVKTYLRSDRGGDRVLVEFLFSDGWSSKWGFYPCSRNSLTRVQEWVQVREVTSPRGKSLALPPKATEEYASSSTVGRMLFALAAHGHDSVYPGLFGLRDPLIPHIGLCVGWFVQTRVCIEILGTHFAEDDWGIFDSVPASTWRPADGRALV